MSKKSVLIIGLVAVAILILLGIAEAKLNFDCSFKANERMGGTWEPAPIGTPGRSPDGNIWVNEMVWDNIEWCEPFAFALLPFIPVLILSLLTYKMRDEVFRTWLHFAYWWIPLSIILTLITPNGSGGWGIPNLISPEIVALTFSALFTIISLILITLKYLSMRPNW
jgi:hypothetical protein